MRIIPMLCCCLILSGCAAKDYEIPGNPLPPPNKAAQEYRIDADWWKLYGDPDLDATVEMALERNLDLARAAISVNKALFRANQIGASLLPSFSSSGSAQSRLSTQNGTSSRSFSASLGLSYELDLWGRLRDAKSASEWEYRATESDRQASRHALVNSVVNTYYGMAYSRQALALSEKVLEFYERLHAIMRNKFNAGKSDALDLAQTEQSILAQRAAIISIKSAIKDEEQTLRNLLDLAPEAPLPFKPRNILSITPPRNTLLVPLHALGARPDVRAAESRILAAYKDLQATREDLYPSISIGGTLGASSTKTAGFFRTTWLNGLVQINLPFLDWNRAKWNIRLSEESFEDAKLAFRKAITSALNEIDRFEKAAADAEYRLEIARAKHQADLRVAEYRRLRYEQGADELRNWLEALRTASSSEQDVLSAQHDRITSANALFQSMGGAVFKR